MAHPRIFTIKAYCTECGAFLMESKPLYKKELLAAWDKAVFDAMGIVCEHCKFPPPNFHLRLVIKNNSTNREFSPKGFLPKPKLQYKDATDLVRKSLMKDGKEPSNP